MAKVRPIAKKGNKPLGVAIGIGNHKGGVGKSTNAVHIAAGLAEKGYHCLLIDLDPTAGATKLLGIDAEEFAGTLEMLSEGESIENLAISEDLPDNLHLVPARTELAELDIQLSRYKDRMSLLKEPLAQARKSYDFIIVDTPPQPGSSLLACSYAALEWFLLSVHAEPLALGGLSETLKDISEVRTHLNKKLEVMGVMISRVKRISRFWKEIESTIEAALPGRNFSVQLSDTVAIQRLSADGITAYEHPKLKKQRIVKEYRALVAEIEKRALNREKFLAKTKKKSTSRRKVANR